MTNKPHPHADVLRAIADGVPLSEFEIRHSSSLDSMWWYTDIERYDWLKLPEGYNIRRKPRTHVVNGFTVPAPMDKEPDVKHDYFFPALNSSVYFTEYRWCGTGFDLLCLGRGLCFATREAAIANAKAMLKIDPSEE